MKYLDLNVNQTFKINGEEDKNEVWTKIMLKPKSCCTKEHNAFYMNEKRKRITRLVGDEIEVTLQE